MEIFEAYKGRWIKEKLDVHHGKDKKTIIKCFESFGVTPKTDLLALYHALDGKGNMDENLFRLWSLDEIQKENNSDREMERAVKFGVLFSDYFINSCCFRVNKNGEVLVDYFAEGEEPILRSNSVFEFFQLMANDSDAALL
jgi:hypothetical protein